MTAAAGTASGPSDYAELVRLARARGLFRRAHGFYARRIVLNLALYALGLAVLPVIESPGLLALDAALLAFVFGQTSFLGHDAAHGQIARSRRANEWLALLHFNLLLGLSVTWWRDHHDPHHAHPNDTERDPDVRIAALAFFPEQAAGKRGLARLTTRWQEWLFFPLLLLEGLHIRLRSLVVLARAGGPALRREAALTAFHLVAFHGFVLLALGPARGAAFLGLQLALTGLYVGSVFVANHTGMPAVDDARASDPLRHQVVTARNLRTNALVDFLFGGLNHQIEHHLLPRTARSRLGEARALVRPFCERRGIPYHETGVARALVEVLRGLREARAPLRRDRAAS